MASLRIIEHCQIRPPSGSVLPVTLPLTIFDVVWLPMPPIQQLYLYEYHSSKDHFTNAILPNIKHSLSLALQHFFPLAGNLTWPQDYSRPEIHYADGDSVSLTVAESDYDFNVLVSNDAIDAGAISPFVPQLLSSPAKKRFPLTSFLVTLFLNKGISIGIAFHHVSADGMPLIHFQKTWASICQTLQGISSSMKLEPLCISRSLVNEEPIQETNLAVSNYLKKTNFTSDTFYTSQSHHNLTGEDKVFATFLLGRADINRLKQFVLANQKENAPQLHLSTFVLTCAYVWICLIKAQYREKEEDDQMEYFLFPVDCRARLEPPLPVTYFGNCLRGIIVGDKSSDLIGAKGIPIAAELIGNAIQEIENGDAILKHERWWLSNFTLPPRCLSVAGSTKLGTHDIDFGWGKPKKTPVISIATTGAISLSQCPSELGDVEVALARDKVEMDAFAFLYMSIIKSFPPCN